MKTVFENKNAFVNQSDAKTFLVFEKGATCGRLRGTFAASDAFNKAVAYAEELHTAEEARWAANRKRVAHLLP